MRSRKNARYRSLREIVAIEEALAYAEKELEQDANTIRAFLGTAVENHIKSALRHGRAQKRTPSSLDAAHRSLPGFTGLSDPFPDPEAVAIRTAFLRQLDQLVATESAELRELLHSLIEDRAVDGSRRYARSRQRRKLIEQGKSLLKKGK